jgi:uncharacterized protein YjdB
MIPAIHKSTNLKFIVSAMTIFVLSLASNELSAQNTLDLAGLSSTSQIEVAYSMRRLSTTYTGSLIQVRRSSDNTTSDIGYDASGHLDTNALKTFVGAGNGFVRIWYDQSGNGNNAFQNTNSSQPILVSSGVILRKNSRPAIRFNGTNFMDGGTTAYAITNDRTLNAVFNVQSGSPSAIIDRTPTSDPLFFIAGNNTGYARNDVYSDVTLGTATTAPFSNTFTFTWESDGKLNLYKNSILEDTASKSLPSNMNVMRIGRHVSVTATAEINFWEIVLFSTAVVASERQVLDCGQQNYYNIVPEAIGGTASVCVGANTTLTHSVTGGTWSSNDAGVASIGSSSGIVTGISPGTTTITYTRTTDCTLTNPITRVVTVNSYPTISSSSSVAVCSGTSTTLTATGGTTYSWSPTTGLSATTGASVTATPTTTTTYTVTGTTSGCSGTASVTVTVRTVPAITSVSPLIGYPSSSVTITGTGFNTTTGNNIVYFGATRATVTASSATSITATIPYGATYKEVSVLNDVCPRTGYSQYPFLPTFDNSAYIPGTVNMDGKVDFTTGTNPWNVAIGDLDGDGKADLAVANAFSATVSVFRNTSSSGAITSGSFAAKVDFATGTQPHSVAIGDLDGDGKADLAVANYSSNTVSVYRNTSSSGTITAASFAAKVDFTTGTNPVSVAIGDLDGDGKADLAVTNVSSASVSVFRNTSSSGAITSGSFAAKVDFTTGTNPRSVSIGDLDGDGKSDLAVANAISATVSVFRNTSSSGAITAASFAAKVDFTTGTSPQSVAIGDLDGDGKADLAVANNGSATVSVLRNTSSSGAITSGSFAAKVDFATGTTTRGVAIGDLDGDGKADLAVANSTSTSVSVFRNTSSSGAITAASFAAKVDFTTGTNPVSVAIGDLDGDGKADLAMANSGSASVSVIRNSPLIVPPAISAVSPLVGYPASSVTITGTNFNTTPANNIVYFGATRATVTTASATSLTVTVPTGATYMPVSVNNTASALTGYSQYPFLPTYDNSAYAPGTVNMNGKVDFATGTVPYGVAIGDLDGDGKADLAVVNNGSSTVSVFRNTSSSGAITAGSFAAKVDFTTGTGPVSVAIGDLDGDGKADLAVANYDNSTVSVFRNTSSSGAITSGSFAAKVDFTTGSGPVSVSIGDLDGDGKADLAVANLSSATVSVLRNTSSSGAITAGSFAAKVDFTTGTNPHSVAIGDLDGDGKADLAVSNYGSTSVSVFRNTSSSGAITAGSFAAKVDFTTGTNPHSVAIGDLDGDGKADLAVTNNGSATVSVFRNTGSSGAITAASFAAKVDFTTGTNPRIVSIGDLDGDGKADLAVANYGSTSVSVFRNTSSSGAITSGSFAARVNFTTGTQPVGVAIGDLDGDGKADLAVSNYGSNTVSVIRNSPLIVPPAISAVSPLVGYPASSVTITGANFNTTPANNIVYFGATRATVTTASATSLTVTVPTGATYMPVSVNNTASALTGYSQYPFLPTFDNSAYIPGTVNMNGKVDFTTGTNPYSVAIGDLDGDGKADLAVVNNGSSTVSVFHNTSSSGAITAGSFAAKVDFTTGTNPVSVSIGDLDGDGKADLAVANFSSATVSVFRNTSSSGVITAGSFAAKVDFATGANPISVAIGDLDGDGKADLAVANYTSNNVSVFRNTGSSGAITAASFAAKVDFATGTNPRIVAIGDLDGDGKADLAVANQSSATVSVFRNTSSSGAITAGSFAAKVDFATGNQPYSVAIGDLDGDGKADLAVANNGSNNVSVFRNTSSSGAITSGSFAAKVDFTTGTNPRIVSIGDLDGDGKADLAVANYGSTSVSVFRNTSSSGAITAGSFAARVDFTTGTNPISVGIGDLDGDGKADLAVANYGSNTVSVIRNNPLAGNTGAATVCVGSTTTLSNATSGGTWSSGSTGIATVGSATGVVTGVAAGTASISYNVSGGSVVTIVTVNPVPTISVGAASICNGASTSLTGSGGSSYSWSPSTGLSATTGSVITASPTVTTTYTVTVPNDYGCTYTATATVTVNALPTVSAGSSVAICSGSSTTLTATGGTTFTWSPATSLSATTGASVSATPTTTVTYTVTGTTSGCSATSSVTVTVKTVPTITSVSPLIGYPSSSVTITGSNFDATTTDNIVYFGATKASVSSASATSLTVTVPTGATFSPVTVNRSGCNLHALSANAYLPSYDNSSFAAGSINLNSKVDFATGTVPHAVTISDVDGDGKSDLIVANNTNASVSVFRNISTSGSISTSSFAAKVDFSTGDSPYSVKMADIDGDGKNDIIVSNRFSNSVSVLRNTSTSGTISFATKVDFTTGTNPNGIVIGDFDYDGRLDIATANFGASTASVLKNTSTSGSISFATKVDFTTGTTPRMITSGDVDGDGRSDLAVANFGSTTVSVLRNTSSVGIINTSSFAVKVDFTVGGNPRELIFADVDGSGKTDMVVVNNSASISVLRNTSSSGTIGAGSFAAKVDFTVGTAPFGLAICDVNGDGKPEVVVGNSGAESISVLRNTATTGAITTSSFAAKVDFTTNNTPYFVAAGDLDGDGKADIVAANSGSNNISIFRNNPLAGTTGVATVCVGSTTTLSNATSGGTWSSGSTGIATVGSATGVVTGVAAGTASISYNVSGGSVVTIVTVNPIPAISIGAATICNGSSTSLTGSGGSSYSWSPSTGLSATTGSVITASPTVTTTYTVTVPNDYGCTYTATATVTVNALPTVSAGSSVAICSGSSTTLTATGGTTFTWSPATSLSATTGASVSATPTTTVTYTVTGTTSGCTATASVTVTVKTVPTITSVSPLIGYPSSSVTITGSNFDATTTDNIVYFGATKASVSSASATSLTVTVPTGATFSPVTVNRSGCNLNALSPQPYLPSYDGSSFASGSINLNSKVDLTTGTTPYGVTIGDVDGDGKSDIIVTNSASNTVSVFRNTSTSGSISTGSFAANVDFATATRPYAVKMADIDGDGKRDIVTTNWLSNSISVLRNTSTSGSISFATKVDFITGTNPGGLVIDDLDGDGKLDIATGNFGATTSSVFRNTSTSGVVSFATKVDLTTGTQPVFITSGDIDGDGKSDLAVSNYGAASVSVLRNISTVGSIATGSFATKVDFTVGTNPCELILSDIDGNGKSDLVVANYSSATISVLRNTSTSGTIGTGTFAAKQDFTTGTGAEGICVGDFDGDSKPDVVVGNSSSASISILRNKATSGAITSGSFAAKVDFAANTLPYFVASGDLDGDGKPDIVVANATSSNISIFRNFPLNDNTGTASVCIGSTTTLSNSASGGTWSSGSAGIATVGSGTGIVTGVAAGTALISYTLSGSPVVTTVTVNALPTVSAGSGVVICAGNSANLTATGGSTYSWSPATGLSATTGSGVSASPTVTTTYTVTGTNTLSCSNTASVTVSVVNTTPTSVTASASPNPICSGANLTLTGSATTTAGTISYAWAGPNSYAATTQNPASFGVTTVSAGVYTITATNACGSTTAVSSTVTVNTVPSVAAISGSGSVCSGQTTTLSCTTAGGTWSSSSTATGSVSSTGVVTGIAGGVYTISYGVSNSCGTSYSTKSMLGYITPTIGVSVGSGNSCVGSTTTYTGTPNTGYTWSSSDTAIATINSGGNVASISAGTTIISYVHNTAGCTTTAIQTVNAVPSFSLTSPSCATTTQTLTGTPAGGTWSSSNTTVATIGSSSGILSTIQGGSTNIQYTYGPCSVLIALSVSPIPGAISGTTSVCSGSTTQLTSGTASQTWSVANTSIATITTLNSTTSVVTGVSTGTTTVSYTNASNCSRVVTLTVASPMTSNIGTSLYCMGQTASLSNTTTGGSWTSSATGIATINSSTGLITPVTTGTSNITYSTTSPSSCQATTVVTVEAALPTNTGSASVCVGQTTTLANSTTGGTWSSSNANATVGSATGVVTGVTAGNSTITYYKSDACYKNSAVTVNANPAAIAGTLSACAGAAATTVTCATASGTWSSSNTSVATIGSSTGVVTPLSSGTTTITYRLTTTGCFSTATFTVNPIPVSFTTSSSVCTGLTTTVSTTPAGGTWVSSATGVASIGSSSGILTGVTTGTTRITYTLATGCSRNETITVNASPAAITGTLSVCEGSISTLANTTSGGTWLSSNTSVAIVGSATGTVTGVAYGTSTITYMLSTTGCYSITTFTVNQTPSVIGGTLSACAGATTTLTNTVTGGTWTSTSTAVATIGSSNGIVTGVASGTSEITYSLAAGCYKTAVVTINAVPVISGTLELCDGSSTTLTATPTGGTWSSGSPAVVTVDSLTGEITGVSGGTSSITYTGTNSCIAVVQVSVNASMGGAISGPSGVCNGFTAAMTHATSGGTWTSSDTTKATINSSTGLLTALSVGSTTITYSVGGTCFRTKWVAIQIQPEPITGNTTICNGSYSVLSSTVGGSGTWSSGDTTIANPNLTSGMISGMSVGTTTITYRIPVSGCQVTTTVDVVSGPTAITGSLTVCQESSVSLSSTPAGGTWAISNEGVATIDSATGIITGVSAGYATVSYTLSTGCRVTAEVTVNNMPTTVIGDLALCPAGTTTLSSSPTGGTWSGSTPAVATISSSGVVSPVSIGTTVITYTLPTSCTRTTVVTVTSAPPAISGEGTVCVGASTPLSNWSTGGTWMSGTTAKATVGLATGMVTGVSTGTALISYFVEGPGCYTTRIQTITATPSAITGTLNACIGESSTLSHAISGGTWSSGNTAIATVDASGVVTAVSAGYAMITYQTSPSCWVTASFNAKALPAAITGTPYACVGTTTNLLSITTLGVWTSSNTGIATVQSPSGTVTGIASGTTTITYKLTSGCYRTTEVTVNAAPTAISGPSALCRTATTTLTCTPTGGTWISSTPAAATINSSTGELTGVAAGTTRITYTQAVTGCRSVKTMTIGAPPAAIAGTLSTCAGSNTTLTNATTGGTWSSANISTATIGSTNGVAAGLTTGTVFISYTHNGGCVATAILTVTPVVVATTGDGTLCVGGTTNLVNSTGGGTWSSSSTSKATVGSTTGIVRGVSVGSAVISYKVNPSCYAVKTVTISPTPAAISGPGYVCINTNGSFTHAVSGGTWSSSNPAVGSIDGSTGVLRGITAGAVIITYVTGNGCFVTKSVNIANNPPAIAGNLAVCSSSASALTCVIGGSATWSSSNTAVGTIGSTSGMLTGVAAGTTTVTYRLNTTGCYSTATATVNALPASITGSNSICAGSAQTYSSSTADGTWSSSNSSAATIGSTSGIATGITAGVVRLSYILPTGCRVTKTVTVNNLPAAITGSSSYCVGGSARLTSATSGGTWSSDIAAATVAGSGTVTATTAGTSVISYTLATGCARYMTVTVNAALPANSGNNSICAGGTTTIINTSGGGTWASSTTTKATVGSATGIVTGVAAGTANISFIRSGAGCISVSQVTVNAALAAITGTTNACVGASSTLGHTITGGTWSSSNAAMATVDASAGVVSGISAGTPVITYTASPGCYKTASFTVKALPSAITGNGSVCTGNATVLSGSPTGGTWASNTTAIAIINTTSGALTGVTAGTVVVTYKGANGCYISTIRTVNAAPASITGTFTAAVGGSRTLSNTTPSGAWTSSNSAIASVTSASGIVTGVATGSALITYTVPNGCFKSVTFTVTAAKDEIVAENGTPIFHVYPNPVSGILNLETSEAGAFRILSYDGKCVLNVHVQLGANVIELPMELAAGFYIGQFTSETGIQHIIRLKVD